MSKRYYIDFLQIDSDFFPNYSQMLIKVREKEKMFLPLVLVTNC